PPTITTTRCACIAEFCCATDRYAASLSGAVQNGGCRSTHTTAPTDVARSRDVLGNEGGWCPPCGEPNYETAAPTISGRTNFGASGMVVRSSRETVKPSASMEARVGRLRSEEHT